VVATRVDAIPEVIGNSDGGLLVNAGDISGLSESICALLKDRPRRRQMSDAARTHASAFTWEACANITFSPQENDAGHPLTARPRVLFFTPVPHFKGGAEQSLLDLLGNPSIQPLLVAPADGPISAQARQSNIPTHVISLGTIEDVHRPFTFTKALVAIKSLARTVLELKRICRREHIHVVHSNGLKAHVVNALQRMLGGPPAVIHMRDIPLTRSEKLVWKLLGYMASQIVLVSRACWPAPELPRNVVVVHNGVDIDALPFRPRAPFRQGPLTVGFVGRIDQAKGLHLLLDWLQFALSANADAVLVVRGRFDSTDPTYEAAIRERIENSGLRRHVRLEGFVSDKEKVFDGIDVVCVPSHVPDPLPRSVMESMARGIPVIAYPAGGIPEMIEPTRTGWFATNAEEFLYAIRQIADNQEHAVELVTNARKRIDAEFSQYLLYTRLNEIYRGLTRGSIGYGNDS
jgi:glycosyltransferase involved in cell wall biosynthesis